MSYQTLNPATEELIRVYPELSWDATKTKIQHARESFLSWRRLSIDERARFISRLAQFLRGDKEKCAALMTQEMGKPISEGLAEVEKCAWVCEFYAEHAGDFLKEEVISTDAKKSYICYEPLGIIFGIMPWNFPFWQVFRFAVPTLMAGNNVILKHAPNVPACALAIEDLFTKAEFPPFTFQSIFISNETCTHVIASSDIAGVSLTGSTRAGSEVAKTAGKYLKKVVLELGGADPFIVLDDADVGQAVTWAIRSRMLNAGQSCIAAKRFIVNEKVYSSFAQDFSEGIRALRVGDPAKPDTNIGPLARKDLLENLERQVESSRKQGAKVTCGGERLKQKGFFYLPTLLENVRPKMTTFDQEVFGPVASLILAKNNEEAISLANKTSYGLGASLWTKNISQAKALQRFIEAGSVFINGMVKSDPRLPFGGIKQSGFGREIGKAGILEFVNIKTVWMG